MPAPYFNGTWKKKVGDILWKNKGVIATGGATGFLLKNYRNMGLGRQNQMPQQQVQNIELQDFNVAQNMLPDPAVNMEVQHLIDDVLAGPFQNPFGNP